MKRIKVAAGVIVNSGKVLITRRAPKENFAGGWEFPGGKIEINETPEQCLVRELKEELDIVVSVGKFCAEADYDYDDISINLIAYYCTIVEGEIRMSVHDKYKWIEISDLLKYELLPADIPIAKKAIEESKG
ncbi:8-oxo-dGTP diphosphatase MutT [Acetivibrio straminisolvens]|uniref:8-oxo-dGTP diphosphatase n=1 Tax=Acetivibrio straminisolvens JCM 21531 TaxID=1294263 RepID=W4VBD2_9FIRM|nr:8-oxo-dGTP diphosphatase MutT [Acetivibrio straminisolvens]GAE90502.1 mutator MutT protein [Acetivibrio straminisolvens JCM 21531]